MKPNRLLIVLAGALLALVLAQAPSAALRQTGPAPQTTTATDEHPCAPSSNEQQASPAALAKLRKLCAEKKTYRVGYSSAFELNVQNLADIEIPGDLPKTLPRIRAESARRLTQQQTNQAQFIKEHPGTEFKPEWDLYALLKADFQAHHPNQRVPLTVAALAPYIAQFDWQKYLLLAVADQRPCNSCWAFAAVAAFEANVYLQNMKTNYTRLEPVESKPGVRIALPSAIHTIDFSEQALINCIGKRKADCGGGWPGSAFDFMVRKGLVRAENRPRGNINMNLSGDYTGEVQPCDTAGAEKVRAAAWGYVTYPPKNPTVLQIKRALLEHGPLAALVRVDADGKFQAYKSGVFNEHDPYAPNHAILIVGWDDALKAWRIQNSWGEDWGEQGFMWIAYDSNGVGQYATWIEAPVGYDWGLL
jgi:cathepsin L